MNVEAFLLCDAATDSNGKLNVLGAFDSVFASTLPTTYPHCAVALRLRMARSELGEHKIALHMVDEDGKHVITPLEGNFRVAGRNDLSNAINLILNIQGLRLTKHGELAIHLLLDGKHVTSLPLHVRRPPGAPAAPPAPA